MMERAASGFNKTEETDKTQPSTFESENVV